MKLSNLAQAMNFSHLLGRERPINVSANIRADDDGDDDDDAMRGKKSRAKSKARADDEKDKDGDDNETDKKGARADEDDEDDDRERREKPDGKKAKRARAEDRERDGDDEEDGDRREEKAHARGVRAGAKAERERCREIFASEAAAGRADVAAHLAFNTNMTAGEAVGTLEALSLSGGRTSSVSLSDRMDGVKTPNPGASDTPPPDMSTAKGMAATMTSVYNKAIGRAPQ